MKNDTTMTKFALHRKRLELKRLSQATATVSTLAKVKAIRDQAEAARHYASIAGLDWRSQNQAAELKLRAERRIGQLLIELVSHGGDRRSKSRNKRLNLAALDIDHNQSARFKTEAAVSEKSFEKYLAKANASGQEITARGLRQWANSQKKKAHELPTNGKIVTQNGFSISESRQGIATVFATIKYHRNLLAKKLAPLEKRRSKKQLLLRLMRDFDTSLGALERVWRNSEKTTDDNSRKT